MAMAAITNAERPKIRFIVESVPKVWREGGMRGFGIEVEVGTRVAVRSRVCEEAVVGAGRKI
jgi:galactose-1-phosphate uridylyltransferase